MEYIKQAIHLFLSGDKELLQIVRTTLTMSVFSTVISSVIGLPIGVALGRAEFKGKGIILRITNTLMGLPPVAAGLIVFMLFRSVGPLGSFRIMFSVRIMVVAQVLLITPVIMGLAASASNVKAKSLTETAKGIGIRPTGQIYLLMRECAPQFVGIMLVGFGRSIAEVGAVSLVGGNIQFKTRVMTTAILLETNKGNFDTAIALTMLLLLISLVVNTLAYPYWRK
ncbi:MAG: ABC transporter permease [Clostridiales bacterium]|jgi:tungstate transport system permease protein|nr:ABC transporter permease [Clostridiales bacterium]